MKIEGEYWKWLAYVSSRNYVKRCGNVEKDGFLKAYYNILDSAPSSSLSKIIDRYITIQKEEHRKNYDENTQNELRLKMLISKPHCSTSVLNYVTYLKNLIGRFHLKNYSNKFIILKKMEVINFI